MTDAQTGTTTTSELPTDATPGRISTYIAVLLVALLAASYYHLRTQGIFACQAGGYSDQQYLAYCQTNGYGDFDHGAFWFNLEPEATNSAANAQLLVIGNSRMQYGLSTVTAKEWLSKNAAPYYLLGFAYHPRVVFQRALLNKLKPTPRMYVINLDSFFEENASVPAHMVMEQPDAESHYRWKRFWQSLHRGICGPIPLICGDSYAIFRTARSGEWQSSGLIVANEATSVEPAADAEAVAREVASGERFLDGLNVDRRCVIFTLVPTVDAPLPTSAAIAKALHVDFIAPEPEDLLTFDGSHLDRESAERWSAAFLDAAGPKIRDCLNKNAAP